MDRAGGPPWGHARGAVLWMGEQGLRLSGDLRCEQSRAAGCLMPQAVAIDRVATHLARCAVQCSDPGGRWAFGMISLPWQSVPPGAWRRGWRGGTVVRWWRHNRGPFALICVHLRQKFLACWGWCRWPGRWRGEGAMGAGEHGPTDPGDGQGGAWVRPDIANARNEPIHPEDLAKRGSIRVTCPPVVRWPARRPAMTVRGGGGLERFARIRATIHAPRGMARGGGGRVSGPTGG
jgi:hypothetical protein